MNNNPNLDKLVNMVGQKLGTDPKVLKSQLEAGKFDSVLGNLNAEDNKKLQTFLKNPALAQKLINTKEAQQTLKKILGE